jgi:hypothetical protein
VVQFFCLERTKTLEQEKGDLCVIQMALWTQFPRALLWQLPMMGTAAGFSWYSTFQDGKLRPWLWSSSRLDAYLQEFAAKNEHFGFFVNRCRTAGMWSGVLEFHCES